MPRDGAIIFGDLIGKLDLCALLAASASVLGAIGWNDQSKNVAATPRLSIGSVNSPPTAQRNTRAIGVTNAAGGARICRWCCR